MSTIEEQIEEAEKKLAELREKQRAESLPAGWVTSERGCYKAVQLTGRRVGLSVYADGDKPDAAFGLLECDSTGTMVGDCAAIEKRLVEFCREVLAELEPAAQVESDALKVGDRVTHPNSRFPQIGGKIVELGGAYGTVRVEWPSGGDTWIPPVALQRIPDDPPKADDVLVEPGE